MTNVSRPLLAVFAHPDDESFGTGGTLARYAAEGHPVALVCTTRGEVGEISDPSLATPQTLGRVREGELRAAARALGIQEVILLDYRDSGMDGTPENQDPRAFINAPEGEVVEHLTRIIRDLRPEIVLTFEPGGGYGHPDHIAISRYTTAAFHAASDPQRFPEAGSTFTPSRLFYTAIPTKFFAEMRAHMEARGLDTSTLDQILLRPSFNDDLITTLMDVAAYNEAKWNAVNAHRTQFGPDNLFRRLPEDLVRELMSREYFSQAHPPVDGGGISSDLFS
ncbi:MAG: GlcNAc-PI de-N-acetylase [Anaerolineaceae bacterium]|nr:MAG: GlcNAc-PI de-N-acetylase [Anaerolineaceae bacterium]